MLWEMLCCSVAVDVDVEGASLLSSAGTMACEVRMLGLLGYGLFFVGNWLLFSLSRNVLS